MDTTKIFETLRQRYNDAKDEYSGQVIAVALFGSQNYGISHEGSDIDTKTILLPSRADIINGAHVSVSERIYPNGINQYKDFRDVLNHIMTKGSISFLECFSTRFYEASIYNADIWDHLRNKMSMMSYYAHDNILHCARGMAKNYCGLIRKNNSLKAKIHFLWIYNFIQRFTEGEDFQKALFFDNNYTETVAKLETEEFDWDFVLSEIFRLKEKPTRNEDDIQALLYNMKSTVMEEVISELF